MIYRYFLLWVVTVLLVVITVLTLARASHATDTDGGGTFQGSAGSSAVTWYGGYSNSTTQTDPADWWRTTRAYDACTGMLRVATAPGAGKQWDFQLGAVQPGATTSCGGAVGSLANTTLCSIVGTDKFCTFSISPTIATDSCLQIKATATGGPTASGGTLYSMTCTSSGDAVATYAASFGIGGNATFYVGPATSTTSATEKTFWIANQHFVSFSGGVQITTAVANADGRFEDAVLQTSTTTIDSTHACVDLAYTDTSIGHFTHAALNVGLSVTNQALDIPVGTCFRWKIAPSIANGYNGGGLQTDLELSTSSGSPFNGGGAAFFGWQAVNAAAQYGGLTANTTTDANFWPVDGIALGTCSGSVTLDTAAAGKTWPITLRYTTSAASGTSCGTFLETSTLCTVTGSSTAKASCSFTSAAVPAAAYGCMDIKLGAPGAGVTGNLLWSIDCAAATPTNTPTVTPTPVPTDTATDTPTPTETPIPSDTPTPTNTNTDTPTETPTPPNTDTPTPTTTGTQPDTPTPTETLTPSMTATITDTPVDTASPTETLSPTETATPANTDTPTDTPPVTNTPTRTNTSATFTPTQTVTCAPVVEAQRIGPIVAPTFPAPNVSLGQTLILSFASANGTVNNTPDGPQVCTVSDTQGNRYTYYLQQGSDPTAVAVSQVWISGSGSGFHPLTPSDTITITCPPGPLTVYGVVLQSGNCHVGPISLCHAARNWGTTSTFTCTAAFPGSIPQSVCSYGDFWWRPWPTPGLFFDRVIPPGLPDCPTCTDFGGDTGQCCVNDVPGQSPWPCFYSSQAPHWSCNRGTLGGMYHMPTSCFPDCNVFASKHPYPVRIAAWATDSLIEFVSPLGGNRCAATGFDTASPSDTSASLPNWTGGAEWTDVQSVGNGGQQVFFMVSPDRQNPLYNSVTMDEPRQFGAAFEQMYGARGVILSTPGTPTPTPTGPTPTPTPTPPLLSPTPTPTCPSCELCQMCLNGICIGNACTPTPTPAGCCDCPNDASCNPTNGNQCPQGCTFVRGGSCMVVP